MPVWSGFAVWVKANVNVYGLIPGQTAEMEDRVAKPLIDQGILTAVAVEQAERDLERVEPEPEAKPEKKKAQKKAQPKPQNRSTQTEEGTETTGKESVKPDES